MDFKHMVQACVKPVMTGNPMTLDLETSSVTDLVNAFVAMKYLNGKTGDRMKELREALLKKTEMFGVPTEKGGKLLRVGGTKVYREKRKAALPDEAKLRDMIESANLKVLDVFTKVSKVVLDASKLSAAINLGKLSEEEVEAAKKVVWALRVKESTGMGEMLESVEGPGAEKALPTPRKKRATASGKRKGK